MPLFSRAWTVAPRPRPGKRVIKFSSLENVAPAPDPLKLLPFDEMTGGANWPVVTLSIVPPLPRLKRLIHQSLDRLRSRLAKRTLRRIWGLAAGTLTSSRFTTFPAVEAIWAARVELYRSFAVPRRKMLPLTLVALMDCPGRFVRNSRRTAARLS